uniref:RRM domain-containing protein n=2 Tax=Culicidae TaxID=7157 RepID=A0A8W7Q0G6_ANOCL
MQQADMPNFWAAVVSERRLERHPGKSDTTRRRTGALRYFFRILPWTATNAAKMKMSKLSNQTNSQDPQAVNSRVFVGNLNTFQCSKTDVERMFQRYGRLAGISMHKGYAFVQFTNPFDARNACHGEDGRTVLSQTLDVNMVAEPKPHQTGRKRQNKSKTGNDWDYYYDR